jgi:hypothetical protein
MLGDTHVVVLGDVHPFCFVFEDFADGAAFDAITGSDVFLTGVGILLVVHTDGLAVDIEETLLALLGPRDDGARRRGRERICSKGLRIGSRGRRRGDGGEGGGDAERGRSGARIGRGVGGRRSGVGRIEGEGGVGGAGHGAREIAGGGEGHGGAEGVGGRTVWVAGRVCGADGGVWAGDGAGGGHEVGGLETRQACRGERTNGGPRRSRGAWRGDGRAVCRGGGTGHVPGGG